MDNTAQTCNQCGTSKSDAQHMLELANSVCLCGKCIDIVFGYSRESRGLRPVLEAAQGDTVTTNKNATPREIVEFLDQYVIGQADAKQTLAIAVYNHYKRLDRAKTSDVEIDKSNVLMLGPTGTGKTLLASSIARLLDVPFAMADATSLTQAGYVGDDVETILQRLIQAADGDLQKAERGIVFVDEIDKIAKANSGPSVTRDVSGEGVQQALLKIIEGARVSVPVTGNRKNPGGQVNYIDTKNILFICAGAFVQLLDKVSKPKRTRGQIGFVTAEKPEEKAKEVTPELLTEFGMIPEFIGRLPVITTLEALDADALERILTEPKNALVRQMTALLAMDDAKLVFEPGAGRAIAEKALKRKMGARATRSIIEELLKQAQFEVPGTTGAVVTVKADLTVAIEFPMALAA